MNEIIKDIIIPGVAVLGGGIGGTITIYIYYWNSKLRRAEWLYSLFEKFFYQSYYADIRQLLDYCKEEQVKRLRDALRSHSDEPLEEKLVNYLNFFEFIASLWQLRQLSIMEIRMMFDYYIRRLGDHDFIIEYLQKEGYEGLLQLVKKVRQMNEAS
jgi:hypothetical protein